MAASWNELCSCTDADNTPSPPLKDALQWRERSTSKKEETCWQLQSWQYAGKKTSLRPELNQKADVGWLFFPFPFPLSKLTEYVWIPGNREKVEFHHKPSLSWGWFWDGCQTAVLPPLQRRQCLTPEYRWFAEPSLYMVVMQGGRGLLGRYSTFQGRSMKKKEEKKQKKKLFGKQQ